MKHFLFERFFRPELDHAFEHHSRGRWGRHSHHDHHHGRGGGRHHGDAHHMMKRLLAHGDLRYVALLLIEEKPRHGYELIKLIEQKSSGQYAPSPGVIYPTLTYLEETGLIKTNPSEEKKQYSITEEGVKHLDENRETANAILKRLEEIGAHMAEAHAEENDPFGREDVMDLREAIHSIMHELKMHRSSTAKNKKKVLEILAKALTEIKALKAE